MNDHIQMIKELWDGIGDNDRFIKFIERHNKRNKDYEDMQINYTIDEDDHIDFGNQDYRFIVRMIIEDMDETKKLPYEELEAQAAAYREALGKLLSKLSINFVSEDDIEHFLVETWDITHNALSSTAGRDLLDKINYLESQCAAYRDTLTDIKNLGPYIKVPLDLARPEELADEALLSDAGRDLLDRIKQLENALLYAAGEKLNCPNDEDDTWCKGYQGCTCAQMQQFWKDYFMHKAGETE